MADDNNGSFDMSNMKSTLGGSGRDATYEGLPATIDEAKKRAREHGYGERVDYNYTERGSTRRVTKFPRCDYTATGELGVYAKRNPELEKDLFSDEKTYGKEMHIDILENVKIEVIGEDPPKPVENVREVTETRILHQQLTDQSSSTWTCIQSCKRP